MKNLVKIIGLCLVILSLNACLFEPDEIDIKHELYGDWIQINNEENLEGRQIFISESEATITKLPVGHVTSFQVGDVLMERLRKLKKKKNRYYCTALHLDKKHGTMKKSGDFIEMLSETRFIYKNHDMDEGAIFEKMSTD